MPSPHALPPPLAHASAADWAAFAACALERLRAQAPLVQSITNRVAAQFTANILLALGAAPAMVDTPGEAGLFARMASALSINLGTPVPAQADAVLEAAHAAQAASKPWVLDPVAIGALPLRTALAAQLLALRPPIIRGNASEILALAGHSGGGRGVDATDSVAQARQAAIALAEQTQGVVAVSGPVDFLTDGRNQLHLANGTPLLTRITGGGCALGAVMAAFAALAPLYAPHAAAQTQTQPPSPLLALTAAAVLVYTIAAEQAAAHAPGPGSFAVQLIDQLAWIDAASVRERARIEVQR